MTAKQPSSPPVKQATQHAALPALPCMCANVRRAARAITQLYEDALRPLGLRATQFTLLQALSIAGEISQGQLGEILAMDSTTLSRTLQLLLRRNWITEARGLDRRERLLRLSPAGRAQLQRATPAWNHAQARLRRQLGDERWRHLLQSTHEVANAIANGGLAI